MYLDHFGLKEPPFRITPHTEFFFSGANRGATLEALIYAITNDEGIVKVSGEVGSGKTMLCRMLLERLPPEIETVSARRLRNARIFSPAKRKTSISTSAMSSSRIMIFRRRFGSVCLSTVINIGRFPRGSIIRINNTATEMISLIINYPFCR